jgi:segregation and condensation protein B
MEMIFFPLKRESIMSESEHDLPSAVEAILFAAKAPLTLEKLRSLFTEGAPPTKVEIAETVKTLQAHYQNRGFHLVEVSSGFRFQSNPHYAHQIAALFEEKATRYSRAFMETLCIIAYRQPITRSEIEAIRGVAINTNIIKQLEELEWIKTLGHKDVPGRPLIYATTQTFLDHFSLKSIDELPVLEEKEEEISV